MAPLFSFLQQPETWSCETFLLSFVRQVSIPQPPVFEPYVTKRLSKHKQWNSISLCVSKWQLYDCIPGYFWHVTLHCRLRSLCAQTEHVHLLCIAQAYVHTGAKGHEIVCLREKTPMLWPQYLGSWRQKAGDRLHKTLVQQTFELVSSWPLSTVLKLFHYKLGLLPVFLLKLDQCPLHSLDCE